MPFTVFTGAGHIVISVNGERGLPGGSDLVNHENPDASATANGAAQVRSRTTMRQCAGRVDAGRREKEIMIKGLRGAWLGLFQRAESPATVTASGSYVRVADKYPTHSRVVLPDGRLMYVRNASLAAAKDLLAAQRSIERRAREERTAYLLRDAARDTTGAVR